MRRIPARLATAATVLVAGLSCTDPAFDQMNDSCPESPLRESLRQEGSLQVIVRIEMDREPEARLTEEEAAAQRQRITERQEKLIADLAGTETEVLRRYERFPMLALQVDEPALCLLLESPLVRSVTPDTEVPPASGG